MVGGGCTPRGSSSLAGLTVADFGVGWEIVEIWCKLLLSAHQIVNHGVDVRRGILDIYN